MWKRQNLAGLSIVRQASMLARQTATSMPDRKPDEVEEEMLRHQLRMAIEELRICERSEQSRCQARSWPEIASSAIPGTSSKVLFSQLSKFIGHGVG
jgi:hypothetical protein